MNPFRNKAGNLNEILFENRNQNYGAYVIRKSYNTTVLKSLGITAGVFILGFWIISLIVNTEPELVADDGINIDIVVPYTTPPKPLIEPPKPQPKAPSKPVAQNSIGTKIIDSTEKTVNTNLAINIQTTGTNSLNITPTDPGTGTLTIEPTNTLTTSGTEIHLAPDAMPYMKGLAQFLQSNLVYPVQAREIGVTGKVWVNFVVDENGKIIDAKILKGIGYGCDEEALRVIKMMPNWKPGMFQGKPVKVSFNQPITFAM